MLFQDSSIMERGEAVFVPTSLTKFAVSTDEMLTYMKARTHITFSAFCFTVVEFTDLWYGVTAYSLLQRSMWYGWVSTIHSHHLLVS